VGRAQGKGIFLFTKLNQISDWKKDYKWRPNTRVTDQQTDAAAVCRRPPHPSPPPPPLTTHTKFTPNPYQVYG
jgi:hypothetical protein